MTGRILVAGVGNVFLRDDAFGVEVARLLAERPQPPGVQVRDFGIRGVHLVYELLNGYDLFVLVDAAPRGEVPGTVTVLEVDVPGPQTPAGPRRAQPDPRRDLRAAVLAGRSARDAAWWWRASRPTSTRAWACPTRSGRRCRTRYGRWKKSWPTSGPRTSRAHGGLSKGESVAGRRCSGC